MNQQTIDKLRALYAKATPGPWVAAIRQPQCGSDNFIPYAMWTNAGPRCVEVGRGIYLEANDAALIAEVAAEIARRPLAEWGAIFAEVDACVTPVLTVAEAAHGPASVELPVR